MLLHVSSVAVKHMADESNPGGGNQDVFDLARLRDLIELMEEHDLSEVDLEQDTQRIRLARGQQGSSLAGAPPVVPMVSAPAAATVAGGGDNPNVVTINSPMVGTFYARPNPESEPFIKVGDHVSPETVVCIIEAMKVFNEIPAEVTGQVAAILAEDEVSVEFGKPLFKIDTSK